ncbi:FCS-Like Zinc finger 5-like [Ziziphus jujuba]|uniref:FCS-Like Zinc finger 5-like n=1 Tax=Ziziphus jujuba TaxID=326968 RepID=A0ABM3IL38_ZIZJJ|nr:FCS-Like Zinc finger 5-like [Ziziphus jujuba]
MLLGKRPRPPLKRTTSLSEIGFDLSSSINGESQAQQQSDPQKPFQAQPVVGLWGGGGDGLDHRVMAASAMVSPRNHHSDSHRRTDFVETAHFLRACSLCKRRLVPSRDIYMYRGDSAFCSLECRQQQMNQDERKEKCSFTSKKEAASSSTKGETVAAS